MAGIVGSMLKKRSDLQAKNHHHEPAIPSHICFKELPPFPQFPPKKHFPYTSTSSTTQFRQGDGSENQTPFKKPIGVQALKASFGSKDWTQKTKQMETPVRETKDTLKRDDGSFQTNPGQSYNALYIGLIICSLGLVISFVGLGDKGFKTAELRLIGPILCIVGLSCVIYKVIQCNYPRLFQYPMFLKKTRKKVDQSNLVEKGLTNGHVKPSSNKGTPQTTHRVMLHSTKKPPRERPTSTIPNFIEDTSDEDDFDPGRSKAHTNPYNSYDKRKKLGESSSSEMKNQNEVVLDPRSLNV